MTALRRVCGWCGFVLGGPEAAPVSHGVCKACKRELLPVLLDTLHDASILFGQDGRAESANAKAREASGKGLESIEGQPYGDIFDCRIAPLPGGCGKTAQCAGCSIRARIEDTYNSGTPHEMVPAFIRRADGTNRRLIISTARMKKGVLLTIHPDGTGPVG